MVEWSGKMFVDVVWSEWRMFDEGGLVRWWKKVVKNEGGNQNCRAATGREGLATVCPGSVLGDFRENWRERERETREFWGFVVYRVGEF
jgi:hypothetical protein